MIRSIFALVFTLSCFFGFSQHPAVQAAEMAAHDQDSSSVHAAVAGESAEAHTEGHGEKKKVDIAEVAFEHILDSHSWHFWGEGHDAVSMPLPVILRTDKGLVMFMSSAFHHDAHGMEVAEVDGQRFVNFKEDIYVASDEKNPAGQYLTYQTNEKGEANIVNVKPLDFSITKNVTQLFLSAFVFL